MDEPINSNPDFKGAFGDKRIERRATDALRKLTTGRNSSLRQITETDAEQKSFYRLFNNESFSESAIEKSIVDRCRRLSSGRHLLCIQDTTEFNFSSKRGRIKPKSGLGTTSRDDILGFMLHSSLVVDAEHSHALGYSYIKTWERPADTPGKHDRDYQHLPIQEKESYKWIAAANQSKALLEQANAITIVADRESDIYDLFDVVEKDKVHLLIRSNHDRLISGKLKLSGCLNALPVMYSYDLAVAGDIRKASSKRIVRMGLKWAKVELLKPVSCRNEQLANVQEIYVVEAAEQNKGIYWRILTTHEVTTAEQALQIICWYKERWHIEQIHRLLKTDGFRIEKSQLEQGWAIRKLTLLAMMASLRILQMMLAYQDDNEQSIDEVFDHQEQKCLQMIAKKLEGATEKLKNTAKVNTLKWATWIIARIGGWKGYTSQRKPGPIVLQKGLAKFYNVYEGWLLYQDYN
ncbi:IS4 family transposase [Mucilaginibacter sp. NFX135]|uniref:IS4 family transposase n=2 Tax=unclassified Mucilaginibacter TaxID=2617802 RepID=UPI003AFB70B2